MRACVRATKDINTSIILTQSDPKPYIIKKRTIADLFHGHTLFKRHTLRVKCIK